MDFSKKVQELRVEAGLSQSQLSSAAGVPLRTIQGWERGARLPVSPDLYRVVKVLGVSTDVFASCDDIGGEKAAAKATEHRRRLAQAAKEAFIASNIEPHVGTELTERQLVELIDLEKGELKELARSVASVSKKPKSLQLVKLALKASKIAKGKK